MKQDVINSWIYSTQSYNKSDISEDARLMHSLSMVLQKIYYIKHHVLHSKNLINSLMSKCKKDFIYVYNYLQSTF